LSLSSAPLGLAYDKYVLPLRACAVYLWLVACACPQNQPTQPVPETPPAEQPVEEYFSGTVIAYVGESITVARTVMGKNSASRRFVVTSETQIEGKLKVKCRVTVQYVTKEEVDRALHIIVRTPGPKK
jgi:hypothetical protein